MYRTGRGRRPTLLTDEGGRGDEEEEVAEKCRTLSLITLNEYRGLIGDIIANLWTHLAPENQSIRNTWSVPILKLIQQRVCGWQLKYYDTSRRTVSLISNLCIDTWLLRPEDGQKEDETRWVSVGRICNLQKTIGGWGGVGGGGGEEKRDQRDPFIMENMRNGWTKFNTRLFRFIEHSWDIDDKSIKLYAVEEVRGVG